MFTIRAFNMPRIGMDVVGSIRNFLSDCSSGKISVFIGIGTWLSLC